MSNLMERRVRISSKAEVEKQSLAYRISKPALCAEGIYTDEHGQTYEFLIDALPGSSNGVANVNPVGTLDWSDVNSGHAGLRTILYLIHNPKSPREARKVEYTVYVWHEGNSKAFKENVVKWVLDIPLKNGKTVLMQIDNWEDIQNGNAQVYQLKTLRAIKPQRFNKYKINKVGNDYDGSEIDQACAEFEELLHPDVRKDIVTQVLDKDKNFEVVELIYPGAQAKHKKSAAVNEFEVLEQKSLDADAEMIKLKKELLSKYGAAKQRKKQAQDEMNQLIGNAQTSAEQENAVFDTVYKEGRIKKFKDLSYPEKQDQLNGISDLFDKK